MIINKAIRVPEKRVSNQLRQDSELCHGEKIEIEDKFIRIAEERLRKAANSIRQLCPLADLRRYAYTQQQSEKIVDFLLNEVRGVQLSFDRAAGRGKEKDSPTHAALPTSLRYVERSKRRAHSSSRC